MAPDERPDYERPDYLTDPRPGDRMNPYGSTRGFNGIFWVVGILVVFAVLIGLVSLGERPATAPPTEQTSSNTVPTVPAQPTPPQPTTD